MSHAAEHRILLCLFLAFVSSYIASAPTAAAAANPPSSRLAQSPARAHHRLLSADSTSTLSCAVASAAVGGSFQCTIQPRQAGTSVSESTSAFVISFSGVTATSTYSLPATGTLLTFTVSGFAASGIMTISATNTAAPFTVGIADTPDSTSSIACAEVFVPLRGAFACTITARKAGAAIHAAASAFSPATFAGGTDAIIANERPTIQYSTAAAGAGAVGGVALTATFGGVVSYASGILAVTDGVSANKPTILITARPDSTSSFECNYTATMEVGSSFPCFMTPRQSGVAVLARLSDYAMTGMPAGAVSFSAITTALADARYANAANVADRFRVSVTNGAVSRFVTINDGVSGVFPSWLIWDTPDTSSSLTCLETVAQVGGTFACSFVPRRASVVIWTPFTMLNFTLRQHANTLASSTNITAASFAGSSYTEYANIFNVSGQGAGLTGWASAANQGAVNTQFAFSVTVASVSAAWSLASTLGAAVEPHRFLVWDNADATSTLLCTSYWVHTSSRAACTITPRKAGATLFAPNTDFSALRANDTRAGSFDLVLPPVAAAFQLVFSPFFTCGTFEFRLFNPQAAASTTMLVVTTPDASTQIVCAPRILNVTATAACTVYPRLAGVSVPVLYSIFAWSFTANSAAVAAANPGGLAAILPRGYYQAHSFANTTHAGNQPFISQSFAFAVVAGSVSELVWINNGFTQPPLLLVVADTPDATSVVACAAARATARLPLACTTSPRRANVPIFTYPSHFAPRVGSAIAAAQRVSFGLALGGGIDGTAFATAAANGTLSAYTLAPVPDASISWAVANNFTLQFVTGIVADVFAVDDGLSAAPWLVSVTVDAACVRAAQLEASNATCLATLASTYAAPAANSLPSAPAWLPASCQATLAACGTTCFASAGAFIWSNANYAFPAGGVGGTVCPSDACATCYIAAYVDCVAPAALWPTAGALSALLPLARFLAAAKTRVAASTVPGVPALTAPFTYANAAQLNATTTLSARTCADLYVQISAQCAFALSSAASTTSPNAAFANATVVAPAVCSPDCAALWLSSGFAATCLWAPIVPQLTATLQASVAAYTARCQAWLTCTAHATPFAHLNRVCTAVPTTRCGPHQVANSCSDNNAMRTCAGGGQRDMSVVCPALGWLPLPATLANASSLVNPATNWTLAVTSASIPLQTALLAYLNSTAGAANGAVPNANQLAGLNSVSSVELTTSAVLGASAYSLAPAPYQWPSIDLLATLPDVCTFACRSAFAYHDATCVTPAQARWW